MSLTVRHFDPAGASVPRLLVHGGAGPRTSELTLDSQGDYQAGLRDALDAGAEVLRRGESALDAVCAAVVVLEDCPLFNAGRGASLTRAGSVEHDAAVMSGDGHAGAVAVSMLARNPVLAARAVMERTPHVLLVTPPVDLLRQWNIPVESQEYFVTEARREQLRRVLAGQLQPSRSGTVGAVAVDAEGHVAVATSTGGMVGQWMGRVGDSAIAGAGTYASDLAAAISCTGDGEAYLQGVVGHDVAARVRFTGSGLLDAVRATYDAEIEPRSASGGTIAVAPTGETVIAHNSDAMFAGSWDADGVQIYL